MDSSVLDSNLVDVLLKAVDKVRMMLEDIENVEKIDAEAEKNALLPFLQKEEKKSMGNIQETRKKGGSTKSILLENIGKERLDAAVRQGQYIYMIRISSKEDLLNKNLNLEDVLSGWLSMGEIFASYPDQQTLGQCKNISETFPIISLVYSSVLESSLISTGLGLEEHQISLIESQEWSDASLVAIAPQSSSIDVFTQNNSNISNSQEVVGKADKTKTKDLVIEDSLRVRVSLLNNLMNLAGELVLGRNQLLQHLSLDFSTSPVAEKITTQLMTLVQEALSASNKKDVQTKIDLLTKAIPELLRFKLNDFPGISHIVQNLDMTTSLLQESIMHTRMQPVSVVFSKFPRVIRDLGKKMGKEFDLEMYGQDVELDKSIIELLSDPLTHLLRNSADHGIETPEERLVKRKKGKGLIVMRAFHEGGKVNIEIQDDGRGIDPEKIRAKAIEKGLLTTELASKMSSQELQKLIFAAGFSTAEVVSDVSGRGVGMDVVKTNIEKLGGTIDIQSQVEKGTTITLRLPLTLAIIPSLIISTEQRRFALPQVSLEEIVRVRGQDITSKIDRIQGAEVLRLRGKLLPLVRLGELLGLAPTYIHPETGERLPERRARWSDRRGKQVPSQEDVPNSGSERRLGKDRRVSLANALKIVVLSIEKKHFGLVVEAVRDTEEIVVKPLSSYLKSALCYSGATIMGDGKVAMILDPVGIATQAKLKFQDVAAKIEEQEKSQQNNLESENLLLFNLCGEENFAIRLSSIARIEKHEASEIQRVGEKQFLKYENQSLQLFNLEKYLPISAPPSFPEKFFVLVPKNTPQPMGIVVGKVQDVLTTEIAINRDQIRAKGILGSTLVQGKLTLLLDLHELVRYAAPEQFTEGVLV